MIFKITAFIDFSRKVINICFGMIYFSMIRVIRMEISRCLETVGVSRGCGHGTYSQVYLAS